MPESKQMEGIHCGESMQDLAHDIIDSLNQYSFYLELVSFTFRMAIERLASKEMKGLARISLVSFLWITYFLVLFLFG